MPVPYDPRQEPVPPDCGRCPLGPFGPPEVHRRGGKPWRPVPGRFYEGARILAAGEAPGREEEQRGEPFVGATGERVWMPTLSALGLRRDQVAITNALKCRCLDAKGRDNLAAVLVAVRQVNRQWAAWQIQARAGDPDALTRFFDAFGEGARAVVDAAQPPAWPSPVECCLPLLQAEVTRYERVFTLGATAAQALGLTTLGALAAHGARVEVDGRRFMLTVHPAMLLPGRAPRYAGRFRADLAKGLRYFDGRSTWVEPFQLYRPTLAALRQFFDVVLAQDEPMRFVAWDCEADSKDPRTARLRDIGFATGDLAWADGSVNSYAVLVPVLSRDGATTFYPDGELAEILRYIAAMFQDPRLLWVGQNSTGYDRMLVERDPRIGRAPPVARHRDLMCYSRLRAPELRKTLGEVGGELTDIDNWKADNEGRKIATDNSVPDEERWRYCARGDCVVTARCYQELRRIVAKRNQDAPLPRALKPVSWDATGLPWSLVGVDHRAQDMAVGLGENGAWIDQEGVAREAARLRKEARRLRRACEKLAAGLGFEGQKGRPFNPGSSPQLAMVLYDKCGIAPREFTETGLASTKAAVMRDHLADMGSAPDALFLRDLLLATLRYRQAQKDLGTFVAPLRFRGTGGAAASLAASAEMSGFDYADAQREAFVEREGRQPSKDELAEWIEDQAGLTDPRDGRLHATWSALLAAPGRLACSRNNQQNVPVGKRRNYRQLYKPAPGRLYTGADLDQAHLRIIANHWKIASLLEAYRAGNDPHTSFAFALFARVFADAWGGPMDLRGKPKKGTLASRMRDIAKTMRFAGAYGASVETRFTVLRKTEDNDGKFIFLDVTRRYFEALCKKQEELEPDWKDAWDWEMRRFREQGFSVEPIFGRRIDHLDGGERSDVANWPVLAGESAIMRLVEADVLAAVPFEAWGPGTGMVFQVHDAIVVEHPADGMRRNADGTWDRPRGTPGRLVYDTLQAAFNRKIPGWEVPITGSAFTGESWDEVG